MAKRISGLKNLNSLIEKLKEKAEQVRENLSEKEDWLADKSEKYQESADGEEWSDHISAVEDFLYEIENIELFPED